MNSSFVSCARSSSHGEGLSWDDKTSSQVSQIDPEICIEVPPNRTLFLPVLCQIPYRVLDPEQGSIKMMTLRANKGRDFPVVALLGAGCMSAKGEDEREEAQLFYVGATQGVVIGASGDRTFAACFFPMV